MMRHYYNLFYVLISLIVRHNSNAQIFADILISGRTDPITNVEVIEWNNLKLKFRSNDGTFEQSLSNDQILRINFHHIINNDSTLNFFPKQIPDNWNQLSIQNQKQLISWFKNPHNKKSTWDAYERIILFEKLISINRTDLLLEELILLQAKSLLELDLYEEALDTLSDFKTGLNSFTLSNDFFLTLSKTFLALGNITEAYQWILFAKERIPRKIDSDYQKILTASNNLPPISLYE